MKKLFYRITGNRPMTLIESHVFTDKVSGKSVNRYIDPSGRKWLAIHKWSFFRVESK